MNMPVFSRAIVGDFSMPTARKIEMKYEQYKGNELKDYTGRDGAMDAYQLPSKMGSGLVVPKRYRK